MVKPRCCHTIETKSCYGQPVVLSHHQNQKLLWSTPGAVTSTKPEAVRVNPRCCHTNKTKSFYGQSPVLSHQQNQKLLWSTPGAVTPTKPKAARVLSHQRNQKCLGSPLKAVRVTPKSCSSHPPPLSAARPSQNERRRHLVSVMILFLPHAASCQRATCFIAYQCTGLNPATTVRPSSSLLLCALLTTSSRLHTYVNMNIFTPSYHHFHVISFSCTKTKAIKTCIIGFCRLIIFM